MNTADQDVRMLEAILCALVAKTGGHIELSTADVRDWGNCAQLVTQADHERQCIKLSLVFPLTLASVTEFLRAYLDGKARLGLDFEGWVAEEFPALSAARTSDTRILSPSCGRWASVT